MSERESYKETPTMKTTLTSPRAVRTVRQRATRTVVALACALCAGLLLGAVPAAAKVVHNSEGSFSASETPAGSFGYLLAIAVDNSGGPSAGDVYVGGLSFSNYSGYVYKFTAGGKYTGVEFNGSKTPQGSFAFLSLSNYNGSRGLAVDDSAGANRGDIYLADAEHHVIDRFNEKGEFLCEITGKDYLTLSEAEQKAECAGSTGSKTPQGGLIEGNYVETALGVAVNPINGYVYVSDPGHAVIDEFNGAGEYVGQISDSHITAPSSLAFNAGGELYVVNGAAFGGTSAVKFDAEGKFVSVLTEKAPEYVSVDPANDLVYIAEGGEKTQTAEYDSSGNLASTFGAEQSGSVGVDAATGRIYISSIYGQPVWMYGKRVIIPNVSTEAPGEVKETTATLKGHVEPDAANGGGNVTGCEFEYASKYTLDHVQTLSLEEKYGFKTYTFAISFEREPTQWHGVGRYTSESTSLSGVMSSEGTPTVGEEISGPGIKAGTTITSYSQAEHKITISQPTGTISHEQEAEPQALSATLPGNATAETVAHALEALPAVGAGNVAVSGPAGGPWTIEFTGALAKVTVPMLQARAGNFATASVEEDWAAASKVPCEPSVPYSGPTPASAKVSGLTPSMLYHYRVMASDSEGPAYGEYVSFTTPGPPSVDRIAAEAKQTSVRFWAKINPFGSDTKCQLQYVSDANFRTSQWANATSLACSPEDMGSAIAGMAFPYTQDSVAMDEASGLERGTLYHYRFLATNQSGSSSQEGTFETWGIRKFTVQLLKNSHETLTLGGAFNMIWQPGEAESPLQAGAHPYEMVTTVQFSLTEPIHRCEGFASCLGGHLGEEIVEKNETMQDVKNIDVELPPGLLGNPMNFPKCNAHVAHEGECPSASQIGILEYLTDSPMRQPDGSAAPGIEENEAGGCNIYCLVPLYNLEPKRATPAEFGNPGDVTKASIFFSARTGSDYGVDADSMDITAAAPVRQIRVRIWGVPGNAGHEDGRQFGCPRRDKGKCSPEGPEVPLLRNPTSCGGPQTATAQFDTWVEPGVYTSKTSQLEGVSGCNKVPFEPTFEARATTSLADSPTGLHVDLHLPQNEDPKSIATADLKNVKVILPTGMAIDPSSADGLQGCSESQVGYLPEKSAEAGKPQFTPEPASCPDASKIGTVEVDTRLIDHPLPGALYVAQQDANPFKALFALYVAIYDEPTGLVIKLPGQISPDPLTGQLTVTFDEDPQLPFEDFKMDLFPGTRAPLTTPLACGSYQAATDLTPWSAPEGAEATPLSPPSSIAGALGGAPCAGSEALAPNAPSFEAGTASPIAASYSPFVLHLKREDGSQHFSAISVTLPPGLTGKIAGIEECSQADIDAASGRSHRGEGSLELAQPSCPAGSEVGIVHVGVGSGNPDYVTGHAYFAGPYKGAPFSLVFITPAVSGPFDLGSTVVRAALYVDNNTAQVTVKSDPLPTILDGIPLDIRSLTVEANRKEFMLNPTSCGVMSVAGQETSTTGQVAALSDRFQAGGCTTLPFDPSFSATASTPASGKEGAALVVKVGSGPGQANIQRVHVTLPKQLPSRLTTLQKACIDTVFNQNPSNCPAESRVGEVVATTPIISTPLSGPAYFVSHGGAKFPELIIVLSGDGITVDLHGETYIDKSQITTSTFPSLPDLPVSSFELKLPAGPYSALAANGDLCAQKLTMPTTIQGQNGAVVEQQTPITVQGCKPEMRVLKHRVKGKWATVVVSVPSAGTLIADGGGVVRKVRRVGKAGIVTLRLRLSKAERHFLAHHRHRRLKVPITLSFSPARGGSMKATVAVLMR